MNDAPRPIVGIGASAGGIEAFHGFFGNMPADSGMGFVVILHLPPDRKTLLPEILARWTAMPVREARDGDAVEADRVMVVPGGVVATLAEGRMHLRAAPLDGGRELTPIDVLFDSLATSLGEDAIGIVLSGTGHDGALGLKAIKARGGLTLAQGGDGARPQQSGMPDSAVATGAVDLLVPVEKMPEHILAVRAARQALDGPDDARRIERARLAICAILRSRLGHDFSKYKDKTFLRRVQRRMQVLRLTNVDEYVALLDHDRDQVNLLFRDLLISVTSFFRDADTFDVLQREVLPRLFQGKSADDVVRVWVPGCATGEEAYSLAILLREHMDTIKLPPRVQVFASDIDEFAIATARAGRYPPTLLQGLSAERQGRFFVRSESAFSISREIRALCTFSAHSLIRDPPFSRIDLISCRNLMIYLAAELQGDVIPTFHYALVPNGVLLLGNSETVSRHENLFTLLDRAHRIYVRRDAPSEAPRLTYHAPRQSRSFVDQFINTLSDDRTTRARAVELAKRRVLDRFASAFVVVTGDGEVVHFSSHTGQFPEPALGEPSKSLFDLARRGWSLPLRAALRRCVETGRSVEQDVTASITSGADESVRLVVEPLPAQDDPALFLVVFGQVEPSRPSAELVPAVARPQEVGMTDQLELEARDLRERLQFLAEEHETALEELRSSNEELQSVNEEVQSANEELETSREEIHSINEELNAVNSQLSNKIEQLDQNNTDLKNLFESTKVATVFLDPFLVIRNFTPEIASIYNLIPSDQGRPITDIVTQLSYDALREDVRHVLHTLAPLERRVARKDSSAHYLMRILPYRTPNSEVDGSLITFVDVTSMVVAEEHQRLLVDELNHRVKNMLTIVISLATSTLRHSKTLDEFSQGFLGRVHALTAAYALLGREN